MRARTVTVAFAVPLLVAGGWFASQVWRGVAFEWRTPLAGGLSGKPAAMRDQFRVRVRDQFPIGTPASQVVADLLN